MHHSSFLQAQLWRIPCRIQWHVVREMNILVSIYRTAGSFGRCSRRYLMYRQPWAFPHCSDAFIIQQDLAKCLHRQHPVFLQQQKLFCYGILFPLDHSKCVVAVCGSSSKMCREQYRYPDTTVCQTDCFCGTT